MAFMYNWIHPNPSEHGYREIPPAVESNIEDERIANEYNIIKVVYGAVIARGAMRFHQKIFSSYEIKRIYPPLQPSRVRVISSIFFILYGGKQLFDLFNDIFIQNKMSYAERGVSAVTASINLAVGLMSFKYN